jgi:glycosyltransferase involved in cell wall biosynthesis
MRNILYLVSTSHLGGVEQLVLRLGRALRDRYRLDVAVIDAAGALHAAYFQTFGTRWDVHTQRHSLRLGLERVPDLLPLDRYDLLHLFNHFALLEILIAWGLAGKIVQSVHFHPDAMRPASRAVLAAHQTRLAGIIVDSRLHAAYLPTATYIPNFVDTDFYRPAEPPGDSVLWIGKFNPAKGPDLLLDIVRRSARHFLIVDGMPSLPESARYRRALAAMPNVELIVEADEATMLALYARSSNLLITSRHEGTPLCLLEAMACGLVPVSTRAGNCPEAIRAAGMLYDTAERAAAILGYGYAELAGPARRRAVEHFDQAPALERYAAIYDPP